MVRQSIERPYISNLWNDFLHKITLAEPDKIDPLLTFQLRQAFVAGFSQGHGLARGTERHDNRDGIDADVLDELKWFSEQARDVARVFGQRTANTGQGLHETHPEMFGGLVP